MSRSPAASGRLGDAAAVGALVAVGLAVFWRVVFLGEVFYYRDLSSFFFFTEAHAAELWRQGSVPLWNALRHGGMPLLAELHTSVLYPSGALFLVLDPWRALTLDAIVHVTASSVAAYALARRLGLGCAGALAVGLVFGYGGFALSQVNLYFRILSYAWTPILLLVWDRWLLEGGRRLAAMVGVLGALQVFAGAPETCAITWTTMLGWGLVRVEPRGRARAVVAWLALTATTLALAAVQLLPTVELIRSGERAGFSFAQLAVWSLHPWRLLEAVLPGFLGDANALSSDAYWGHGVEGAYPYFVSLYLGALVPALALLGGLDKERWSGRFRAFLAGMAAIAVLLAFGRHGFLLEPLVELLPPLRIFRHPVKLLGLGVLPIALLAGLGVERLATLAREPATGRRLTWLAAALALAAAAALALVAVPASSEVLQGLLFGETREAIRAGLGRSAGHAAAVCAAAACVLAWAERRSWARRSLGALIAALVAIDLATAAWPAIPTAPLAELARPPAALELVHRHLDGGRLYSSTLESDEPVTLRVGVDDPVLRYRWYQEVLGAVWVGQIGIPVVFHEDYTGLAPRRLMTLRSLVSALPWPRRLPLLAAAGVTVVATFEELELPGLSRLARIGNAADRSVSVYRLDAAARPFEAATRWVSRPDASKALEALVVPGFDPRRHAVVEGGRPAPTAACVGIPEVELIASSALARTVEVASPCPAYLVHSQTFDPGWEVEVDGARVEVVVANGAFSAVFVEAGRHRVEWRYRPRSFRLGLAISLATLAAVTIWLAAGTVRDRRRAASSLAASNAPDP